MLIVELARAGDEADGAANAPPAEAFEFAEEEVARVEEEADPFDML